MISEYEREKKKKNKSLELYVTFPVWVNHENCLKRYFGQYQPYFPQTRVLACPIKSIVFQLSYIILGKK